MTFETDLLELIFNSTAITELDTLTRLYLALMTADPGETGTMTTNETSYTSYARVSVPRTSTAWTVSGNSVSPTANISFPAATGGSGTVTHAAVGASATATHSNQKIFYSGTVTPNIAVSSGVTPQLTTGSAITED
jgi:hypothetical protein